MAKDLKGTLTQDASGLPTTDMNLDPAHTGDFQAVMRDIARKSYVERSKGADKYNALKGAGAKPSEVSGSTFSTVMDNLERLRGGDISKEFSAGVSAYKETIDAIEKKRQEAKATGGSALTNMTKTLSLIQGFQSAGLPVPPELYAALGVKDPNQPITLSPEDMVVQQTLATSVGQDGNADPEKYKTAREAYLQTHKGETPQIFDQKFGSSLSEEERKNLGITIVPKTTLNTNTPEYKAAQTIMSGTGRLSDVSTAGNLRTRTGEVLAKLREESLKSGDIYGIMRASAGGSPVDATTLQSFEQGVSVLYQLSELANTTVDEATGPILGIIRSNNPYDTKAQEIKAQLQAIVPNLARGIYHEVGVLTDSDIANYSKTLPNLKSTEDVKAALLVMSVKSVQRSLEQKIKAQAGFGGRDVSGAEQQYREVEAKANELQQAFDKSIQEKPVENTKDWLKTLGDPKLDDFLSSKGL